MNKSILLHHSTVDKQQPRLGEEDDDSISSFSATSCASSTSSSSSFDKGGHLAAARLLYQKQQQMQQQRQQRQLREALAAGDTITSPQQEDETGVAATGPATKKRRRRDPPIAPVSPSRIVTTLLPSDVLCGRGIHIGTQPGNIRLHEIVRSMQEQYQQSTRQAKPLIIQQIVQIARSEGARFLRKAPRRDDKTNDSSASSEEQHSWEIVENEFVYQKVSHTLRNQKYQTEQKKKEGLQYSVASPQHQHARHPRAQALQHPFISVAAEAATIAQNLPTAVVGFPPSSSSAAASATGTRSLDLSGMTQLQLQSSFIPQQQPAATPFLQSNTDISNNLASLLIPLLLGKNDGGGNWNAAPVTPPTPAPPPPSQLQQPLQPFLSTLFSMVSSQQIPTNMIVPLLQAAVMYQQHAVVSGGDGGSGGATTSSSTPTANSTITTPSQQEVPLQGSDPEQLNLSSSYDNHEQQ